MEAAALYQKEKCDSIISIGGGSSHDAAKGARVVIAHDGRNINEFEGFAKSTNKENPPHIAVSTTAGTGSETSWAYVITDTSDMNNPHKCVGFDEARYRLGYGGGYYDRTLAAWPAANRPATIGVAFESGRCDALPHENHDMPLDAVVTESAIY